MPTTSTNGKRACPLFLHRSGQWAKKIHGKTRYFGSEKEKALERLKKEWPILAAGGDPRRPDATTVEDLCDDFMAAKLTAQQEGRITPRHYTSLYTTCRLILQQFGFACPVADLAPESFDRLRARFSKGRGIHALALHIRHARSVFKHGYEAGLIEKPVRFGPGMAIPSAKDFRRHRAGGGERLLSNSEIRTMLKWARPQVKAAILMGINCGFGAADCAELPKHTVDLQRGWSTFPRVKTGIVRRCPLWPETIKALQAAIAARPDPKQPEDDSLVFLTIRGHRWVREWTTNVKDGSIKGHRADELGDEFKKLMRKAKIDKRGSFYLLRHTFETIGAETGMQIAVDSIMGHVDPTIGGRYRERIADEQLRKVTDHVRGWLFFGTRKKR
jgi:integrase